MNQTTINKKTKDSKPRTDNKIIILFKDVIRPVLSLIASFRVPYKVVISEPARVFSDKPVIYAVNHFCFADTPIMGRITPKRSYILLGKQRLGFSDLIYFILNGVIFVDRKDKNDRAKSKMTMIAYLNKGRSIVIFPEGTWNLTENKLMLPIKWGIVDIAKETGAQVIPVAMEYDREQKKCLVCFGEPIAFSQEDSKAEAITALRDTMSTMCWKFWESRGIFHREDMDIDEERQALRYSIAEYPPIDWEYESSCIYHPHTEPDDVFAHLKAIEPCMETAFLFNKRLE